MHAPNTDPPQDASIARKILIVDDELRNLRLLETVLQANGYATCSARSGNEAIVLFEQEIPAIVLLDLMMPDMDGFELIRRLRSLANGNAMQLIVASALDDTASRQRVLSAGVAHYFVKPLDRMRLLQCIKQLA